MAPIWLVQIGGLFVVLFLLKWCERQRFFRGTYGEPKGVWLQKGLRVVFFFILTGPLLLQFPLLLLPALLYLPTYVDLSELKAARRSAWFGNWRVWHYLKGYFSVRLVKTAELDAQRSYIFAVHPHGILPFGGMFNMSSDLTGFADLFPGIERRGLAASFTFFIPLYRDFLLAAGICDAARYNADNLLRSGYSICLVPGGATEALYSSPHHDTVYIKNRLGFVRLAMKHGVSIVPVFSFNETNTFDQFTGDHPWIDWIKRQFQSVFGISLPLIKNIIPRRVPVTSVCGRPFAVPQIDAPTDEQVREYLDKYIDELRQLYQQHKHLNIIDTKDLRII